MSRRRILWNIYAWPMTLFLAAIVVQEIKQSEFSSVLGAMPLLDVCISLPTLLTLHLHIWDRRFLSPLLWKIYSFLFMAWELFFNFFINSIITGKLFNPANLLLALPLYIALFRYAFRKWEPDTVSLEASTRKRTLRLAVALVAILCGGFVIVWPGAACESLGFKWAPAENRCVTPLCYNSNSCGHWACPIQMCSRVHVGDSERTLHFILGEPDRIEADSQFWTSCKGAGPEDEPLKAIVRSQVVIELHCPSIK